MEKVQVIASMLVLVALSGCGTKPIEYETFVVNGENCLRVLDDPEFAYYQDTLALATCEAAAFESQISTEREK